MTTGTCAKSTKLRCGSPRCDLTPRRQNTMLRLPSLATYSFADQIAASLEKAKKSAASGERLYKSGIIAKVDAENRVLKVIRLEAELAAAKLELAKQNTALEQARLEAGEIATSEVETAKSIELAAIKEAEAAAARKDKAELDAAVLNLYRQQKLLAMGSGRKAEVNRAQEKVLALQQKD